MTTKYKLTIAVPTYNRKEFLKRALNSLVNQISDDVEIIVCDNASTDGTDLMVTENYPQIRYYRNESNIGAARNFLECYKKSQGQYVLLLGSDDIVIEGAVSTILSAIDFGKEEDVDFVFLNHGFFINDYHTIDSCYKLFIETNQHEDGKIVTNKNELAIIVQARLTYMSCFILNRTAALSVSNPEQYIDTSFLHSCLAYSVINSSNKYYVVYTPCIAANMTSGDAGLDRAKEKYALVFSVKMKYLLCEIAVRNGFSKRIMKKIFFKETWKRFTYMMLSMNAENGKGKDSVTYHIFWDYLYKTYKEYFLSRLTIFPSYFMPRFLARLLYYHILPIKRKIHL